MFGGLFQKSQPGSQESLFSNLEKPKTLNFNLNHLINSPKKSKKKRLYIKNKKIPKWAEKKDEIENPPELNGEDIFGAFQVENLSIDLVFSGENLNERNSGDWSFYDFQA